MPTFFFHSTGALAHRDDEGVDLPDEAAAQAEGLRVLGELLKDGHGWSWAAGPLVLQVTDAAGQEILSLEVSVSRPASKPPAG